jgi:hypothetical protein
MTKTAQSLHIFRHFLASSCAIVIGAPPLPPPSLIHELNRRAVTLQVDLETTDVTSVMAVPVSGPGYGHSRFYVVRARISPSKTTSPEKLPLIDAAHLPPAPFFQSEPSSLHHETLRLSNTQTLTTFKPLKPPIPAQARCGNASL